MDQLIMDLRWAELTIRDYVCSNCWGQLQRWPTNGSNWLVQCIRCREQTNGFVTRYFAESRRSDSIGEARDVRLLLQEMGIIANEHDGKSAKDLLKEMGF